MAARSIAHVLFIFRSIHRGRYVSIFEYTHTHIYIRVTAVVLFTGLFMISIYCYGVLIDF